MIIHLKIIIIILTESDANSPKFKPSVLVNSTKTLILPEIVTRVPLGHNVLNFPFDNL